MPYCFEDTSEMPILQITLSGTPTDEEFRDYLARMDRRLRDDHSYGYVLDFRNAALPTVDQRRMQAEWIKDNEERIAELCFGTAFVFEGAIQRLVLSTIMLVTKMPSPYTVCGGTDEAKRWLNEQLDGRAT